MDTAIISALVRHALTAVGGVMAAKYGVDGATVDAIAGGLATLAGVLWSISDKRRRG